MWIVLGEDKGLIKLVSKSETSGILPSGAYLTALDGDTKFILQVTNTYQNETYSPSPLVVDMDLSPLKQDQRSQNIVLARRVKDLTTREDGLIDFIKPQILARRSTQDEIDAAIGESNDGPELMLATVHASQNSVLVDDDRTPIKVKLPKDMFFHQILICGKTGSGKTVGSKYLAQWFLEELEGAVLAINVKDVDFLKMNEASTIFNPDAKKEWDLLGIKARGISNTTIYYPANANVETFKGVDKSICKKVCLSAEKVDPESLVGLVRGISDVGARSLPDIFRYWKEHHPGKFIDFITYFRNAENDNRRFQITNAIGEDVGEISLHAGTYQNVLRSLFIAEEFFDKEGAEVIGKDDILEQGKLSVINVATKNGIDFGSTLLRHLLHEIVEEKSQGRSAVPILIIIDEVHQFYNAESSRDALGDLDTICRTGRSQEIGVIFSSQNPQDIPKGLSNVINTKIIFKSDINSTRQLGNNFTNADIENLKKGFAAVSIHDMSQIKFVKFPIAKAGVFEKEK